MRHLHRQCKRAKGQEHLKCKNINNDLRTEKSPSFTSNLDFCRAKQITFQLNRYAHVLQSSEKYTHAYEHTTLRAMHTHTFLYLLPWKSATDYCRQHWRVLTLRDGCTLPFILCYNEIQFIVAFDFAYSRTYQTKEKQINVCMFERK